MATPAPSSQVTATGPRRRGDQHRRERDAERAERRTQRRRERDARRAEREQRSRPRPVDARELALSRARSRATRRIAFLGHLVVWAGVCCFILVAAGFFPALLVALAWGIGLAAHGFFFVVAPELHQRWVERELGAEVHASVTAERRLLGDEHSRDLRQTTAALAHEIRNPITAAKSLVQQIAEDPGAAETPEYAKVAVEELDRVERAVSHLLRYSREEPLSVAPMDLASTIDSALETLRERIDRSLVIVERDYTGPLDMDGDADKLRRVVINLVTNALDAAADDPTGSPQVSVGAGTSLDGRELWLEVTDNGLGMDEQQLQKIFRPFFTSKEGGTGLGLAISRKLVAAHGGTLEARSSVGEGARFLVTLPALAEPPSSRGSW